MVKGFDGLLRDQASLEVMTLSMLPPASISVGDRERSGDGSHDNGAVEWKASADEIIVSDENIMCRWEMTTVNACARGARFEVSVCCLSSFVRTFTHPDLCFTAREDGNVKSCFLLEFPIGVC